MSTSRIKIRIVPSRSGRTWSVWVNGWRAIRQTAQPLAKIASRMIAAGHRPDARIWMTKTPGGGPCRCASTLGAAATAEAAAHPFRAPDWRNINSNGAH